MEQYYPVLGLLLLVLFGAGALGSLFWSLHKAKLPVPKTDQGWFVTRRSAFENFMVFIFLILFVFCVPFMILILVTYGDDLSVSEKSLFSVCVLFGIVILNYIRTDYMVRIRFYEKMIEYQAAFRTISVNWSFVDQIKMGYNGPTVCTAQGNFSISNTRRGFYQMLRMARDNHVKIQNAAHLNID